MSIDTKNNFHNNSTKSVKIFDKLWNNLRSNNKDYIYGKDLILLINKILDLSQSDSAHFQLPQFIKIDQVELINKFSNENDMIEIYKFTLNDILKNLINMTILEFISNCNIPESNVVNLLNNLDIPTKDNAWHKNEKENFYNDVTNKKNLENDDLTFKQKYELLKNEYEYYRLNQEKLKQAWQKKDDNADNNNHNNNNLSDMINSKFLIAQFDKQLNEQTELINNLKLQIELRNASLKNGKKSISDNVTDEKIKGNEDIRESRTDYYIDNFFKIIKFLLQCVLLTSSIFFLYYMYQELINQDNLTNDNPINLNPKWWERSSFLNKLKYSIEDAYNDYRIANMLNDPTNENDSYNKIFGLE